jgi:two-component system LytT family response regulator
MKAVIVDDEPHALLIFRKVLEWFENDIEIVGEANNLPSAISMISESKPDVVFMDIDMPNYSGLQINDFFQSPRDFEIVFITAHSDYSIKALRINAFDYLLKPLEVEALKECYQRLKAQKKISSVSNKANIETNSKDLLSINSKNGVAYVTISDIVFIQASSMYSIIITKNEEHIVSKPLKEFEFLTQQNFFRNHRSYIINCNFVKRIANQNGNEIELTSGHKLPLARNRVEEFKLHMQEQFSYEISKKS